MVQQAGGAPVEDDWRAAVVPGRGPDTRQIETGLPRPVLLWVQSSVGGVSARGRGRLVRLGLKLCEGRTPGSGVGVSIRFPLLRRTVVGLGLLAVLLHCAVGGGSCGSGQRSLGEQSGHFSSGFLAVVLHQTVALGALFGLVVGAMVARDGGQVTVLRPDGRGQRVQGELGLAGLAALLQKLIDGQGVLFDQHPALVVWSRVHEAGRTLFHQRVQLCVDTNTEQASLYNSFNVHVKVTSKALFF